MLCLNCGKEIGDKIGLCDDCGDENPEDSQMHSQETVEQDSIEQEKTTDDTIEDLAASTDVEEEQATESTQLDTDLEEESVDQADEEEPKPVKKEKAVASAGLLSAITDKKPIVIGVVALVLVLLLALVFGSGSSDLEEPVTEIPPESATNASIDPAPGTESEAGVEDKEEDKEIEFPTAPHFATGSLSVSGVRYSYKDVIFVYHPYYGRIEAGFYSKPLTLDTKREAIELFSLAQAPEQLKPIALFTIYTKPGVTVCTNALVESYDVRFFADGKTIQKDVYHQFGNDLGGIVRFACQLKMGAPFSLEISQNKQLDLDGETKEFAWDFTASGPVYELFSKPKLKFSSQGYWQMGVWDKEKNVLEVGFFRERLNAEERLLVRKEKSLRAVKSKQPDFKVSFEVKEEVTDFRRENIRSYGVHFLRSSQNDGRGFSFPGEKDEVAFYEIVSSEPSASLENVAGFLFETESIKAKLNASQTKEIGGEKTSFDWDIDLQAPLIDVMSDPVSSVVFDPELAQINRDVPAQSGGLIEAGKASAKIVDAIALFYPAEANIIVGMYSTKLSAKDRKTIIANKGVWQRARVQSPVLVLSIDLAKGETSLSKSAISTIMLTFVRDRLGDFFFPGNFDRATIKKSVKDLADADLPYVAGLAEEDGTVAIRLNGSHISKKSGLAFSWKLEVSEKVTVIE